MDKTQFPKHWQISDAEKAKRCSEVGRTDYATLASEASDYARKQAITKASKDPKGKRICFLPIDVQNTFCVPGFELYVGGRSGDGAVQDSVRMCDFIYSNIDRITAITPTQDTHTAMQIFHPYFWVNDKGEHPIGAQTIITLDDLKSGKWKVNPEVSYSVNGGNYAALASYAYHYVETLEKNGKFPLMVWPYHAMLGGVGHALVAPVEEALFFHSLVRGSQTKFQIKGGNPLTENYSILQPEVMEDGQGRPIAQRNTNFIDLLLSFDIVAIGGQAKSHCVSWTISNFLDEIKAVDPKLAQRVVLLEDLSSSVVVPNVIDFTDQADAEYKRFEGEGMRIRKSTDPIDTW